MIFLLEVVGLVEDGVAAEGFAKDEGVGAWLSEGNGVEVLGVGYAGDLIREEL
ncbi:MAG: hypothetical protein RIG82_00220 [Phycisphaeraceae bacterium]